MYLGYKTAYATLTPGMAWAGIYWPITPGSESHVSLIKSLLFPLLSGEMGKLRQNLLLRKTYMVQYFFQMQIVCMFGHTVHKRPDKPAPTFFFERSIS